MATTSLQFDMAVKRLTKDYYDSIFNFYRSASLRVVRDEQFRSWINNLQDLNVTSKSYFYNKYEFFVNGDFSQDKVRPKCVAILKKNRNYSAEVKSIIVSDHALNHDKDLDDLVRVIEMYCAETGIRTVEFYTNTFNKTSNYFISRDNDYYLLFKREIDSRLNYEYVFRRNILIDYFGDTSNWRDLSLWFLEAIFLPLYSQNDLPNEIIINNSFRSFLDLPEFQSGFFDPNTNFEINFLMNNKNVLETVGQLTKTRFKVIICGNQNAFKGSNYNENEFDVGLLFSVNDIGLTNSKFRTITWQHIISHIRYIHQQYNPIPAS